jgi:hypothetical protein
MDINIEVLNSNSYFFTDSLQYDAIVFTSSPNQRILFGTQSNETYSLAVTLSNIHHQRITTYTCNAIFSSNIGLDTEAPKASIHTMRDIFVHSNNFPWPTDHGKGIYMRYSTFSNQDGSYIQSIDRDTGSETSLDLFIQGSNIHHVTGSSTNEIRTTLKPDGKFGIATSNPMEILDIAGNAFVRSNIVMLSNQSIVYGSNIGYGLAGRIGYSIFNSNSLDIVGGASDTQTGRYITFYINSNQGGGNIGKATFNGGHIYLNTGHLGIGASNPLGQIHIARGNTTSNNIIIEGGKLTDGTNEGLSAINFNGYFNTVHTRINTNKNRWRIYVNQVATSEYLGIDSFNGVSTYSYLTLSNYNIGINKTNPNGRLHIVGSSVLGGIDGTQTSNNPLTLEDNSGSALRVVHVSTNSTQSTIYNYQQTKSVYWGEQYDMGGYYFRGRFMSIGTSNPDKALIVGSGSTDTSYAIKLNTGDSDKIYLTNSNNGSKIAHSNSWTVNIMAGQSNAYNGIIALHTGSNSGYQERMRLDTTGYVGINTRVPTTTLHLVGISNTTFPTIIDGAFCTNSMLQMIGRSNHMIGIELKDPNSSWYMYRNSNDSNLIFAHSTGRTPLQMFSNNVVWVTSNLSVGLSNPESEVHVNTQLQVGTNTLEYGPKEGILSLRGNNTITNRQWIIKTGATLNTESTYNTQRLRILDSNTERMTIDNTGAVGIGRSNPSHFLDINGNMRWVKEAILIDNEAIRLRIGASSNAAQYSTSAQSNDVVMRVENNGRFLLQAGTAAAPFCINSNNRIGINTIDPTLSLDIFGDTKITSSNPITLIPNHATGLGTGITITPPIGQTQNVTYPYILNGAIRCSFSNTTNWNAFSVDFNSNQMVRIDQLGNTTLMGRLSIGTSNQNAAIQLSNITANRRIILWENSNNDHNFTGFGTSASNLRYQVAQSNHDHLFYGATTNAASAEIMRLRGNGQVFFGNASGMRSTTITSGYQADGTGGFYYYIGFIRPETTSNVGSVTFNMTFGCTTGNATNAANAMIQLSTRDGLNSSAYLNGNVPANVDVLLYNNSNIYIKSYDNFSVAFTTLANTCFAANQDWESTRTATIPSGTLTRSILKTNYVVINSVGNFGIGVSPASSNKLQVAGAIQSSGDIIAFSDARFKTNIDPIDNALEKLIHINGYTYNMIENSTRRHAGLLAQELEEVLPEVVYEDDNGKKSVAYGNTIALLVQAVKELHLKVERLEKELEERNIL